MYTIFQSHLDLAHQYWKKVLQPGDIAIDATCGNGIDTQFIAEHILTPDTGKLYIFDIQEQAIEQTKKALKERLPQETHHQLKFIHGCHSQFPEEIHLASVKLIVYNLGYLPKGDKSLTTMTETTLKSLHLALDLVQEGGLISITCYPGHPEGKIEEETLTNYVSTLPPWKWSCLHHRWLNRNQSPSLLLLQKRMSKSKI